MKIYEISLSNFTKTEMAIMRNRILPKCKVAPEFISDKMIVSMICENLHTFDRKRNLDMKEVKNFLPISLTKKIIDLEEYYKSSGTDEFDPIVVRFPQYKKLNKLVDEEYLKYINVRHDAEKGYTAEELDQINDFVFLKELSNKEANSYDVVSIVENYFLTQNHLPTSLLTQEVINHLGARLASKMLTEMREEGNPVSHLEESVNEVRTLAYGQAGLTPPKTK